MAAVELLLCHREMPIFPTHNAALRSLLFILIPTFSLSTFYKPTLLLSTRRLPGANESTPSLLVDCPLVRTEGHLIDRHIHPRPSSDLRLYFVESSVEYIMAVTPSVAASLKAGRCRGSIPSGPSSASRHVTPRPPRLLAFCSASAEAKPARSKAPAVAGIPPTVALELQRAGVDILGGSRPPAMNAERYAMEKKSTLLVLGLSVHRTPVDLREKISVPEHEVPRAIEELCRYPHILEAGVLSTCNRLEVYILARSFHPAVREVEDWMERSSGVPLQELRRSLFVARGDEATDHLMTVAAGLDSLVVGEGQILAQVRQLHGMGQDAEGFGRVLNALFKAAVTTGKRVRSETSISEGAVSVSGAAAELAELKLRLESNPSSSSSISSSSSSFEEEPRRSLAGSRVAIVGAGKMSRLLVKHLYAKGAQSLTLVNRSTSRGDAFAAEFPELEIEVTALENLSGALEAADVAFFASASPDLLITKADAEAIMTTRAATGTSDGPRRMMLVDIAVPRNVDSSTGDVPGCVCYNVDDLKQVVDANKSSRGEAAAEARGIIRSEVRAFAAWKQSLESVPKIKALRDRADAVVAQQLQKHLSKLDNRGEGLTPAQQEAVMQLTHGVVNKLLHDPISSIRASAADTLSGISSGDGEKAARASAKPSSEGRHWLQ